MTSFAVIDFTKFGPTDFMMVLARRMKAHGMSLPSNIVINQDTLDNLTVTMIGPANPAEVRVLSARNEMIKLNN